jgi:hypothetical protein
VRVLPGIPDAVVRIIETRMQNDTVIGVFGNVSLYGKIILGFNSRSKNMFRIENILTRVFHDDYRNALSIFYGYIPSLRNGLPPGSYSPDQPSGIKSLNIPLYPEDKSMIKPKLLLVLVGPSNGLYVSDPVVTYYFGFEVTGTLYPGTYTRVAVVVSVVIDHGGRLYGRDMVGVVAYYAYGSSVSMGLAGPLMAIYGFIGLLASGIPLYATIDEDYKYYLYIFILFSIQVFSFFAIIMALKIPVKLISDIVVSLGPWYVIINLLWLIPYFLLAYIYHSGKEDVEAPSPGRAAAEGVLLAFILIFLFILSIDPGGIVRYLMGVGGPEATYLFIVILSGIIVLAGLLLGGMWAKLGRIREYSRPAY